MKTHLLQLEPFDDVVSTRDKMTWSKAPRILLVWPRRGRILRRRVDLALLARQARELGAQLALVTRDPEVKINARDLGVPVFRTPRQAQNATWTRLHHRATFKGRGTRPRTPPEVLRDQQAEFHPAERHGFRWLIFRIAITLIGFGAVFALGLFFFPSAEVSFSPARQPQQMIIPLYASVEISQLNPAGGIPARAVTVQVEARVERAASGSQMVPQDFATGTARLTNLTANPIDVPAGLVLLTAGETPRRFTTLEKVTLPGGPDSDADVPVRALAPGSAGNILPGEIVAIESSLGLRIAVSNPTALAGGAEASLRAPDRMDEVALQSELAQALRYLAIEQWTSELAPGEELIIQSGIPTKILSETRTPLEGQPGETLVLESSTEHTALAIREADVRAAVRIAMDANLPEGFVADGDGLTITPAGEPFIAQDRSVQWKVQATRQTLAAWTSEQIIALVMGKTIPEAIASLNTALPLAQAAQISTQPAWWPRLPYLPFRITVTAQ